MGRQKETVTLSFYRSMGVPFLISLIIIIGIASWGAYVTLLSEPSEDGFSWLLIIGAAVWLWISLLHDCSFRDWNYVKLSTSEITSNKLYKKNICTIDLNKPVYYSILKFAPGKHTMSEVLLISNTIFDVIEIEGYSYTSALEPFMRNNYDSKSQVVVYYNSKAKRYLPKENWIPVTHSGSPNVYF